MKEWKKSNWLKCSLLIAYILCTIGVILFGGATVFFIGYGAYDAGNHSEFSHTELIYTEACLRAAEVEMPQLFAAMQEQQPVPEELRRENCNLSIRLYAEDSFDREDVEDIKPLYQNFALPEQAGKTYTFELWDYWYTEALPEPEIGEEESSELTEGMGGETAYDSIYDAVDLETGYYDGALPQAYDPKEREVGIIALCTLDLTFPAQDAYQKMNTKAVQVWSYRDSVPVYMVIFLLGWVICFICLLRGAGHVQGSEEMHLRWTDKLPLDLHLLLSFGGAAIALFLALIPVMAKLDIFDIRWFDLNFRAWLLVIYCGTLLVLCALFALEGMLTLAIRIKTGGWWKNSLLTMLCRVLWKGCKAAGRGVSYLWRNLHLAWRTVAVLGISGLIAALAIFVIHEWVLFLWGAMAAAGILYLLFQSIAFEKLRRSAKRLAAGELSHQTDIRYLYGSFRRHAEDLNCIGQGIQTAVEQRLKSERFKTELITNVSHDIKTPLTSIINYVDLLKKEPLQTPASEYVAVLERQSARLKKLIDDLTEASKASTGNIQAELQPMDAAMLLSQCTAEYQERFAARGLQPRLSLPEQPCMILADGRLMWRVMDNLLSNICKYAMEGTRVYLDCEAGQSGVCIRLRNISENPLNISEEALLERFTRGDRSRHTEGSGLGLNIAGSLMALQGGDLQLHIDGDLFKAELHFAAKP